MAFRIRVTAFMPPRITYPQKDCQQCNSDSAGRKRSRFWTVVLDATVHEEFVHMQEPPTSASLPFCGEGRSDRPDCKPSAYLGGRRRRAKRTSPGAATQSPRAS